MAAVTPARGRALATLSECRRRNARARDVLRASSGMAALSDRDRAFAQRLVLGVTGASGALDAIINAHLRRGTRLEPRIRDALRLASYELCWMDTPVPVAVDQGVNMVRSVRTQAAGLANAVLRKVGDVDAPKRARAHELVQTAWESANIEGVTVGSLACAAGYPSWLLQRVVDERGMTSALSLAMAATAPPPIYVAPNLALGPAERLAGALREMGGMAQASCANAYELSVPSKLGASGFVERADLIVSDLAAQRVVASCDIRPGMRVLEVGQGRGTKSMLMENAALMRGGAASIVGIDSEPFKVRLAMERMATAGLASHVSSLVFDGRRLATDEVPDALAGPFDLVFVDAPCSGTGTLRRHPEAVWGFDPRSLDGACGLPRLQGNLLCAAASRVCRGGRLAYATCSVLSDENDAVVKGFLASPIGRSFTLETSCVMDVVPHGHDGHFLAVMRRA